MIISLSTFGQFSYLFLLTSILIVDLIILLVFYSLIVKYKKTIVATVVFFSFIWYFLVDPLAVRVLHIWFYNPDKILNIWIAGTAVEEFLWMILVSFLLSTLTIIFIEHQNKKHKEEKNVAKI